MPSIQQKKRNFQWFTTVSLAIIGTRATVDETICTNLTGPSGHLICDFATSAHQSLATLTLLWFLADTVGNDKYSKSFDRRGVEG